MFCEILLQMEMDPVVQTDFAIRYRLLATG